MRPSTRRPYGPANCSSPQAFPLLPITTSYVKSSEFSPALTGRQQRVSGTGPARLRIAGPLSIGGNVKRIFLTVGVFMTSVIAVHAQSESTPSDGRTIKNPAAQLTLPQSQSQSMELTQSHLLISTPLLQGYRQAGSCQSGPQNPCAAMKARKHIGQPLILAQHDAVQAPSLLPPTPVDGSMLDFGHSLYPTYGPGHDNLAIVSLNGFATAVEVDSQASAPSGPFGNNSYHSFV